MEQELKNTNKTTNFVINMEQELKDKTIVFFKNLVKFITNKKTIILSSSLCILIIILIILNIPATEKVVEYDFVDSGSLFSNMPYDL